MVGCSPSLPESVKQLQRNIPIKVDDCPTFLCEGTIKKEVFYSFLSPGIAHDTCSTVLYVQMSSAQRGFGVQTVHQSKPGKEFDSWGAP
jgi:hypothetical protein